jgi:hypothetical protein
MEIPELFALPIGTTVQMNYLGADPVEGEIIANDGGEIIIRWSDGNEHSIEATDDEWLPEVVGWMEVVGELPADVPIVVTDMGRGD